MGKWIVSIHAIISVSLGLLWALFLCYQGGDDIHHLDLPYFGASSWSAEPMSRALTVVRFLLVSLAAGLMQGIQTWLILYVGFFILRRIYPGLLQDRPPTQTKTELDSDANQD